MVTPWVCLRSPFVGLNYVRRTVSRPPFSCNVYTSLFVVYGSLDHGLDSKFTNNLLDPFRSSVLIPDWL